MSKFITSLAAGVALCLSAGLAQAGGHANWTLDAESSRVAFGSVKADVAGEVHHFSSLSGSISEQGEAVVEIDVASVQTNIDIRNERMLKWVFTNGPKAVLSAGVDMEALKALGVGDTMMMSVDGTLALNGNDQAIQTDLFIAKLADNKIMATTDGMVMLSIDQSGLTEGVDKLMELAGLPGITRVSPVTLRLVFGL